MAHRHEADRLPPGRVPRPLPALGTRLALLATRSRPRSLGALLGELSTARSQFLLWITVVKRRCAWCKYSFLDVNSARGSSSLSGTRVCGRNDAGRALERPHTASVPPLHT